MAPVLSDAFLFFGATDPAHKMISAPAGCVPVGVVRTDEERMIAKTLRLVLHLGSDRET